MDTSHSTASMRAISQDELGEPDVLKEIQLERPSPGPGEVLVRVRAAGLNPTDWKHRRHGVFLGDPPFVLGWEVSGVVEETGLGVTVHDPGDEVFGMLPYPHGVGSHAEYVVSPARGLVRKPSGLDHVRAGALPLAGLTAWQALVDTAGIRSGGRILVHAAAGGVGHLAVQIAKSRGAHVTGTARTEKHEMLRGLGADEVIDYRETDFAEAARDMDVVLDSIGSEDYRNRSLRTLRPGGILVSIILQGEEALREEARRLGVHARVMLAEADHAGMSAVAALAEAGTLSPVIAGTFPLADAARAHEALETGRTAGKLVLTMD